MQLGRLGYPLITRRFQGLMIRILTFFTICALYQKFNGKDPDTFFSLFERVAEVRNWPESACALMLQCVLTGRAQEAYSSLTSEDSKKYSLVKKCSVKSF